MMAALVQVIATRVLRLPIPEEFINGIIGAIFLYLILWSPLSPDDRPAPFLQLKIPLRERLKILAYFAILLVWVVASSYLFDEDSSLRQRLITWGSFLFGSVIGFLIAIRADAYLQRRKGEQRKIQGGVS